MLYSFYRYGDNRLLHVFPTRRSSDLRIVGDRDAETVLGDALQRAGLRVDVDLVDRPRRPIPQPDQAGLIVDELGRSEEHTSELQSRRDLVCRLLLEKKK